MMMAVTVLGTIGSLIAVWGVVKLIMRKAGHKSTSLLGRWMARQLWPAIVESLPDAAAVHIPAAISSAVEAQIAPVAHQVKPRNGKTLAMTAEETNDLSRVMIQKLDEQGDVVNDLRKGMAAISVLVAEHVSDGHGGQKSW